MLTKKMAAPETLAALAVTDKLEAEIKKLRQHASRDRLTRLPNYDYWADSLEALQKDKNTIIVIVSIDVNLLKTTNDTFGHDVGDQLLIDTSTILKSAFRETDIVVRNGADEFAVAAPFIISEVEKEYSAYVSSFNEQSKNNQKPPSLEDFLAQKIHQRISQAIIEFAEHTPPEHVPVSLSYGVAVSNPPHDLGATFQKADEIMYHHKQQIKAQIDKTLLK